MAETTPAGSAAPEAERGLAAVAYILTWITGLIVFLVSKKEEKYKRWHAVQAIGLGIVIVILYIILNVVIGGMIASGAGSGTAGAGGFATAFLFGTLIWILTIIAIVVMAVTAYQGKKLRIPLLAGFADKYA